VLQTLCIFQQNITRNADSDRDGLQHIYGGCPFFISGIQFKPPFGVKCHYPGCCGNPTMLWRK